MSILHDGVMLARLKRSMGRDHATPRPLSPIEVASCIEDLTQHISLNEISKRLNINARVLRDFLNMKKTPKKYHDVWGWGKFVGGKIPWSAFRRAGDFLEKKVITVENFSDLVQGVLNEDICTTDVEDILYLKTKNPDKSFEDCYKEISNMEPEIIKSIVFVADLNSRILKDLNREADSKSMPVDSFAASILRRRLGSDDVEGVLIKHSRHIKIALTEQGRKNLGDAAARENVSLNDVINRLFLLEGFGND